MEKSAKQRKLAEEKKKEIYVQAGTPKLSEFLNKKTKYTDENPEQCTHVNEAVITF